MAAIVPPWTAGSGLLAADIAWTLESNTSRFVSPLSKQTQLSAKSGARWRARVSLRHLTDTQLHDWSAFLARCQDEGRSMIFGPGYPRGRPLAYPGTDTIPWGSGGSSNPRVLTAGFTGFELDATGFAVGAT